MQGHLESSVYVVDSAGVCSVQAVVRKYKDILDTHVYIQTVVTFPDREVPGIRTSVKQEETPQHIDTTDSSSRIQQHTGLR